MTSYVSYETAVELKDFGFPQPEFIRPGDAIYTSSGRLVVVSPPGHPEFIRYVDFVYAPSLEDIMKELGDFYKVGYDGVNEWCITYEGNHYFKDCKTYHENNDRYFHTNPAEAAAKTWIKDFLI